MVGEAMYALIIPQSPAHPSLHPENGSFPPHPRSCLCLLLQLLPAPGCAEYFLLAVANASPRSCHSQPEVCAGRSSGSSCCNGEEKILPSGSSVMEGRPGSGVRRMGWRLSERALRELGMQGRDYHSFLIIESYALT